MTYHPRADVAAPTWWRRQVGPTASWRWRPRPGCPSSRRSKHLDSAGIVVFGVGSVAAVAVVHHAWPMVVGLFVLVAAMMLASRRPVAHQECLCRSCLRPLLYNRRYGVGPEVIFGPVVEALPVALAVALGRMAGTGRGRRGPAGGGDGAVCAVEIWRAVGTTVDVAPPGAFVAAVLEAEGEPYFLAPADARRLVELVERHCRVYCSEELTCDEVEAVQEWAGRCGTERAVELARTALA